MKHYSSVVTTTELSPPPRWLATIEATPPFGGHCGVLFSVLGGLSGRSFLKTAPHFGSVINACERGGWSHRLALLDVGTSSDTCI